MTSLVELSQVKDYLGITTTDDDNQLSAILESVQDSILQMLGDLSQGTKTMQVKNTDLSLKEDRVRFLHKNVTAILTINGVDFTTKTEGTDFIFVDGEEAIIPDLWQYIDNEFGVFTVTYTAGWADGEVPEDFVGIVANWVALQFSLDYGREVTRETMGPRTVEFANNANGGNKVDGIKRCKQRLRKYLPNHLRAW